MRVFYSPAYIKTEYAFDTTRKAGWIADSLAESPIPGVDLTEPTPLTFEQVAAVHDPGYVRAVETGHPLGLAESQGFDWDSDLWPTVLASNGGMVAAALSALEEGVAGSLSSGLHHARYGSGAGFCTFNGLVLAAQAAMQAGISSVLILDLDAHCGGGTASLIEKNPTIWQADVDIRTFDSYTDSDRVSLDFVFQARDYLSLIRRRLKEIERRKIPFGLCLYNAGMDPYKDCPTGGMSGITVDILAARERMVFEWCRERKIPVAFALAGGYIGYRLTEQRLVDLHRLTLSAAVASGG